MPLGVGTQRGSISTFRGLYKQQGCRMSVRVGCMFEDLLFVPVRVKFRLRVKRFVSPVSEICLRVMSVGNRVPHCVFVCLCMSCVSRVTRTACHSCQNYCVPCVSCAMRVRIGCGSDRVRVRCLRVCGSRLFLRVLEQPGRRRSPLIFRGEEPIPAPVSGPRLPGQDYLGRSRGDESPDRSNTGYRLCP
jgi:hypothetical protein